MTLTRDELRSIAGPVLQGPCVSLFMPTHRAGPQVRQDPIRLKNLVSEAEKRVADSGARGADGDSLLAPVRALTADESFWRERSDGLAIFVAPGLLLVDRTPAPVEERVFVGERFHLKPLLPFLTGDGRYSILALSQKQVRCFTASRETITPLPLRGIPARLEDAVGEDFEERSVQSHTATAPTRPGGRGRAVFHGHGRGGDQDSQKREILHFVEMIDAHLDETLPHANDPLVLAGTEEIVATFRATSGRRNLVEGAAFGSPDGWTDREIHERTWPLVEPRFLEAKRLASEKFPELRAHGRASADLRTVLRASAEGRIAELFIALEASRWGRYDAATDTLDLHEEARAGDVDLVDEIAVQTLLHDGVVYCTPGAEIPGAGPVAANFRYPLHERKGKERDPGDVPKARRGSARRGARKPRAQSRDHARQQG